MPTDEALVERAKLADQDAFEELFIKYRDMVFNLAWRISGSREEAEDITQKTFVKAYLGLFSFRGRSRFTTWLYRIAVNEALRARSSGIRRAEAEQPINDLVPPSDEPDPARAAQLSEMERGVRRAISELPPAHRAVITLRYTEGLQLSEIAEILGTSVGTIKSRLHHALKSLSFILRDWKNV